MDSWRARKRFWEDNDDSPIANPNPQESAAAPAATAGPGVPPLPQHAGNPSRDSQTLSQRRLPPLYTPACTASAEPVPAGSLQPPPPTQEAYDLSVSRPRSLSLFDIFQQQPKRQRLDSGLDRTVALPSALDLDRSLPPISIDGRRPRFGTDPAPHAAGAVICCPSDCKGQACSNARTLMHKLASELVLLDTRVRSILRKDYHSSNELPEFEHTGISDSLQWALELVQWTNANLREHIDNSSPLSPEHTIFQPDTLAAMRRGQNPYERDDQSSPSRHHTGALHGYSGFAHPGSMSDDRSRNIYGSDNTPVANSPHHTTSSSGSVFMPPQSPMQAPQPSRPTMLPSPSSMNFPNVPNLPPISPPAAAAQTSAQAAHLQELQHQVSVKTLAFQTLQREYDSLLQKLERQRTKCATLEKKFEVSDVEINSLTDEKEKLQSQVTMLETQVEELQQSRDEARRQLVANGAQYMRIMEMANRLQAQSADDKKKWDADRAELERRIKVLEEAMVTGQSGVEGSNSGATTSPSPSIMTLSPHLSPSSSETVNVLRAEIGRLRARTQTLEAALQAMKQESLSIQSAARQLVESGGKIEQAAQGTIGG